MHVYTQAHLSVYLSVSHNPESIHVFSESSIHCTACLSVCLSICLSHTTLRAYMYLVNHPSIVLPVCLSIYVCLSICLSVCLSHTTLRAYMYLVNHPSIVLPVCLSIYVCLSICLSVSHNPESRQVVSDSFIHCTAYLSVCLSVCLSIYLSVYLSHTTLKAKEGRQKCFISRRTQHILFMVIWHRTYGKGPFR